MLKRKGGRKQGHKDAQMEDTGNEEEGRSQGHKKDMGRRK